MFTIRFTPQAEQAIERMGQFPRAMIKALREGLDYENEITVGVIVDKRLSFPYTKRIGGMKVVQPTQPDGLRVVSGRLRRSIRRGKAVEENGVIVSSIGSNVSYAGVHEYGYSGMQSVPQHTRRVKSRNVFAKVEGKRRTTASGVTTVKAHSRQVNFPARRYISRTIEERLPQYVETLSGNIVAAWEKVGRP